MSQYKWGDKVWVHNRHKGIVTDIDSSELPYYVAYTNGSENNSEWFRESELLPRNGDEPATPSNPIESAVSAMATEPTSKPSEPEIGITESRRSMQLELYFNTAIGLLEHAIDYDHKLLGHDYPAKAIEAALPLLRNVRDELN